MYDICYDLEDGSWFLYDGNDLLYEFIPESFTLDTENYICYIASKLIVNMYSLKD